MRSFMVEWIPSEQIFSNAERWMLLLEENKEVVLYKVNPQQKMAKTTQLFHHQEIVQLSPQRKLTQ